MTSKATIAAGATATLLVALALGYSALRQGGDRSVEIHPSFLYGRITTVDGDVHEGRLRFGGDEEAFWGDYFNGFKDGNPWAAHVASDRLPKERRSIELLGFAVWSRERPIDLGRPFMARFGDISRVEANGRDLRVTLKSGTVVELDRYAADDFADGVRVWDHEGRVLEFDEREVRSIDLLAPTRAGAPAPHRLHGTVRTAQGDFTGFLQWDREAGLALDPLEGHAADGELVSARFATIRSIARRSPESALVTLVDGSEMVLSDTPDVGEGNRGVYVDDSRYGRVLVSWHALERVDFSGAGRDAVDAGPGYGDFPRGRPLAGVVTTRDGRHLAGRLVYDLDESEVTETLDAPAYGVDYTIPFGLVTTIVLPSVGDGADGRAHVTLRTGEELRLELAGDLGGGNAGMLIFPGGRGGPEYVPWSEIARVAFDRDAAGGFRTFPGPPHPR